MTQSPQASNSLHDVQPPMTDKKMMAKEGDEAEKSSVRVRAPARMAAPGPMPIMAPPPLDDSGMEKAAKEWVNSNRKQKRAALIEGKRVAATEKTEGAAVEQKSGKGAAATAGTELAQAVQEKGEEEGGGHHQIISYSWATKNLVKSVHAALKEAGVRIWFDEEEIRGSVIDRMAEAVEGARAILMCYSQAYKNSSNCRAEAQYAYKLQKPIILVLWQQQYNADGWLGFILGSTLYYDVSTDDKYKSNVSKLVDSVRREMAVQQNTQPIQGGIGHGTAGGSSKAQQPESRSVQKPATS